MATATWNGKNDNWSDADNWAGGSGTGGIPDDGDDVVFPPTNNQSVFQNMDRAGGSGENLHVASIIVHKGFGGQIGTSAAPLACTVSGTVKHNGDRPFYFKTDTTTANTTGDIIVNSGNNDMAFQLQGDTAVASMLCARGTWSISGVFSGSVAYLDQYVEGGTQGLSKGILESGAQCPTVMVINGGECHLHSSDTGIPFLVMGGKLIVHPGGGSATNAYRIGPNGQLDYRSSATVNSLVNGGLATFLNSALPCTVSELIRLGGSILKYDPELVTITKDLKIEGP